MTENRTKGDTRPTKISKALRAAGGDVYSTCTGFTYPRNGNVFNPTPRLLWIATLRGRIVTASSQTRRAAIEILTEALKETQS